MKIKSIPRFLIVATSVLLTSCGKKGVDTVWWEGEQQRLELAQQLALQEFRLGQRDGDVTQELVVQERKNHHSSASLDSFSARRNALRGEIDAMESGMITMRENFLRSRREAVTGKTFETFTAWNGRTYHQMSVSSVDDAGVSIRHADGSARLRYRDLNDAQRQMFGLDAERALAATDQERADAVEYGRWIDRRMVAIREKEAERERLATASKLAAKTRLASNIDRTVVAANVSPLAKSASTFSSRGSRYSSSYHRYRPSYSTYYYPVPVYRNPCVPSVTYLNRLPADRKPNPYSIYR